MTVHFRGGAMTSGDIAKRFSCTWPTTVRHLQALERAGLLVGEWHGRSKTYTLDRSALATVTDWLAWFEKGC